jgi:hypothetical protein
MTMWLTTEESILIPDGIKNLAAFREWFHSETFPQEGRICFFDGMVWVDTGMEQLFSHNQVKQEFNLVLGGLVKSVLADIFLTEFKFQIWLPN